MKLALLPLDERPVNARLPRQIAHIAGHALLTPPPDLLSRFRQPADTSALAAWLHDQALRCDGLIVSLEMLAYGGLIASRISHDTTDAVIERLDVLRELRQQHPHLTIYGFGLIMRISRHNDATEEPAYWAKHGADLFRWSQLTDRADMGDSQHQDAINELQARIPMEALADFLWRRARNHSVNRAALRLTADGLIDLLVLSSDDTTEYSLASAEKRILAREAEALQLGARLLMYPGADEVGAVLTARLCGSKTGSAPTFRPIYLVAGGTDVIAPFEDSPVRVTVERQIRAVGGHLSDSPDADVWLFVHPPVDSEAEWVRDHPNEHRGATECAALSAAVAAMGAALDAGRRVALADVAYANGASGALMQRLLEADLRRLIAFGAWNTAGNTIGTVVAQACAALEGDAEANADFLAHRLIEDYGYQTLVRPQVRAWLRETTGCAEPTEANLAETAAFIAERLPSYLNRRAVRVRLPWNRTFEIDFDIERV